MNEHVEQQKRDEIWKGVDYKSPEINHTAATAIQIEAWALSGDALAPWFFSPAEIKVGLEMRKRAQDNGDTVIFKSEKQEEANEAK
jgi:hypothetical protein